MMRSKLQFFGQAIDGKMDLGEDGLTDIVVGARGAVVVLRYESKKRIRKDSWFKRTVKICH